MRQRIRTVKPSELCAPRQGLHSANPTKTTRKTVLSRDGNKCVRCGSRKDLTIDHIYPRCIGGTNALANLRTLCRSCNSSRPAAEGLTEDLARDGYKLEDMNLICMGWRYNETEEL